MYSCNENLYKSKQTHISVNKTMVIAASTMYATAGNCMEDVVFGGQRVAVPKAMPASRAGVYVFLFGFV